MSFYAKYQKFSYLRCLTDKNFNISRCYSSRFLTNICNEKQFNRNQCQVYYNNTREICQSKTYLSSDEKLKSFREREEQKEAEYNLTPEVSAPVKEDVSEEDEQSQVVRNKILEASLPFVEGIDNCGWSRKALVKGAESVGYPGVIHGVFARGGVELVNFYYLKCNQSLMEEMQTKINSAEKIQDPKEFVRWALQQRLSMNIPYIKSWPQALGIMTLPPNVPTSLANLLTLVDDICHFTGDRSVDFNWYTRRIGLATIYKATELFMLQDKSPGYESTWKFLERRVEDASIIHDVLVKTEDATQNLQKSVGTAFTTARNILGLNFDRR